MFNYNFIKLIKTPINYYLYDANKNDIFLISNKMFQFIHSVQESNVEFSSIKIDPNLMNEFHNLKKCGALSYDKTPTISNPIVPFIGTYLDRKVNNIVIQTTTQCNFRCSYCIYSDLCNPLQRQHSDNNMSALTASKIVDFVYQHSIDADLINFGFYGGEPLLNFEIIQIVVQKAQYLFRDKVNFHITTNGSIMTDEIIGFLASNHFSVLISIDGLKDVHDANRRFAHNGAGTFDTIVKNIKRIYEKHPDLCRNISCNSVIDPQNDYTDLKQLYDFLAQYNITRFISSVVDDSYSFKKNHYTKNFLQSMKFEKVISYLALLNKLPQKIVSPDLISSNQKIMMPLENKIESMPDVLSHSGPCIPGYTKLFIDYTGTFYPCEKVSEKSNCMKIGNIDTGFDYDQALKLSNLCLLTSDKCNKCWAIHLCNQCLRSCDSAGNLSGEFKKSNCRASLLQAEEKLRVACMLKDLRE